MDFKKLINRYRQFGGLQLFWEYAKLGVLWPGVKAGVRCLVKGQSFKGIYPEVLRIIEPYLIERYSPVVSGFKFQDSGGCSHEHPKVIWWCWLQGIDAAPEIIKACYNSLVHGEWFIVQGYEVRVIDDSNWREYVELPSYIEKKWEKGRIPAAMFSDLLRVEIVPVNRL